MAGTYNLHRASIIALAVAAGLGQAASAQDRAPGDRRLAALLGVQSATVAPQGFGFAALALTSLQEESGWGSAEGTLAFGTGFGRATGGVGVQVTAYLANLSDGPGDSGSLSIKLAHRLDAAPVPTFVAVSVDGLAGWGDLDDEESASVIVTSFPEVTLGGSTYPLMVTLGAATDASDSQSEPGLFAGIGIGLTPNLGASLAWSGDYVTLGASFRVEGLDSVRFSATVQDVFDDQDERSVTLAATYFVDDLFGR